MTRPTERPRQKLKVLSYQVKIASWCAGSQPRSRRYVISFKPSPAILAPDTWDPEAARRDIREVLDLADGRCHIEIVMKEISTVRYEPQRLWEWSEIAMEEALRD